MSIIKELTDSHDTIKGFAIYVVLLPFWYIALLLFNNDFFVCQSVLTIAITCLAITISSVFPLSIAIGRTQGGEFLRFTVISIVILTLWLCILIFFFYSLDFLFGIQIYFYWFLVIYIIPGSIAFICSLLVKPVPE